MANNGQVLDKNYAMKKYLRMVNKEIDNLAETLLVGYQMYCEKCGIHANLSYRGAVEIILNIGIYATRNTTNDLG